MSMRVGGDSHEPRRTRKLTLKLRRGVGEAASRGRSVVSSPQVWRAALQGAAVVAVSRGLMPRAVATSVSLLGVAVAVAWSQTPEMGGA